MPAPTFTDGTIGNVLNAVSVPLGATVAALLDLSTAIEGQLACDVQAGASPPTVATVFNAYKAQAAYKSGSPVLTLGAAVTAGTASTSLTVSSQNTTAGLRAGELIAICTQNTPHVGEIVTISSVSGSGTGPYTVAITGGGASSGTLNSYSSGDYVFALVQTPVDSTTPTIPAASKANSAPLFLGNGRYVIAVTNADSAQGVTASVTLDTVS